MQAQCCGTLHDALCVCLQAKQSAAEAARRAQGEAVAARKHAESLARQWREAGLEALDKLEAAAKEALDKVRQARMRMRKCGVGFGLGSMFWLITLNASLKALHDRIPCMADPRVLQQDQSLHDTVLCSLWAMDGLCKVCRGPSISTQRPPLLQVLSSRAAFARHY